LIKEVFAKGVNVTEIYIDTIGPPQTYQAKLSRIFPTTSITVAKKADSLYPCVSAASVCAKVTRDAALEVCYRAYTQGAGSLSTAADEGWGSGYPSDARCSNWLKRTIDPIFGWGNICRFSWATAKDLLEAAKGHAVQVDWPSQEEEEEVMLVTDYFGAERGRDVNEMAGWFGGSVGEEVF
jgi:ribonuclease H2 subunit A